MNSPNQANHNASARYSNELEEGLTKEIEGIKKIEAQA